MGGGVVAAMAVQKTDNVASVILVDGSIDSRSSRFLSLISRSKILRKVAGTFISRFVVTRRKIKSFLDSAYGREPSTEEIDGYYQPLRLKNTYLTFSAMLRKHASDKKLSDELYKINVPVLCLWGRDDEWVPLEKGKVLIEKIPEASLIVIDEAKHCPMETHPELFNRYLLNFFPTDDIVDINGNNTGL